MAILLYRVDERLIHGQVVLGWGVDLRPGRYIVVDDDLSASEWEQELYRLSVPDEVDVVFVDAATARSELPTWRGDVIRSVLLARDPATMASLAEGDSFAGVQINLGGIHHQPGRREVTSYLFLDDGDREAVRRMADAGATVTGQDLPGAHRVDLAHLLR
jgi:PTS system mannose-specific IIB component/fructoselysine and glucoselysine-specific PTS system IIB component